MLKMKKLRICTSSKLIICLSNHLKTDINISYVSLKGAIPKSVTKTKQQVQGAVSGPQDRLAADMAETGFNWNYPVQVDGNLVVEGRHRVMAAEKAGVKIVTTPGIAIMPNGPKR